MAAHYSRAERLERNLADYAGLLGQWRRDVSAVIAWGRERDRAIADASYRQMIRAKISARLAGATDAEIATADQRAGF